MRHSEAPFYPLEWLISRTPVSYPEALREMENRAAQILSGWAGELIWSLEHPPLYTAGASAKAYDLLSPQFPLFQSGRGGRMTYHGPGQRVVYLMLNLQNRVKDLRLYVSTLEAWLTETLKSFGIDATPRSGRVGLWVETPRGEKKIAAIGVRVQKWVTLHGVALNVHPNLDHFKGIVPCGLKEYGVTSLQALGIKASLEEIDRALQKTFFDFF